MDAKNSLVMPRRPTSLEIKLMVVGLGAVGFQAYQFLGGQTALLLLAGFCGVLIILSAFLFR